MVNYSKYPFLPGARSLANTTTELKYMGTTFSYFNRLLDGPFFTIENTDRIEVNVFLNCMVLLKKIDNKYTTRKFISNFAKRFELFFLQDISNMEIRNQVMDFFNISTEYQTYRDGVVKMSIPYYLALVRDDKGAEFRLINQMVDGGVVTVSNPRFVLILRNLLERLLLKRIDTMMSVDHIEIDDFLLQKYRQNPDVKKSVTKSGNNDSMMPPCMSAMIQEAKNSHHLNHIQRLTLGIFLKSKEYDENYILDIYKGLSDYSEKTTKYQLSRLDKYQVYGCERMVINGLCRKEEDKHNRCSRIRNPFLY